MSGLPMTTPAPAAASTPSAKRSVMGALAATAGLVSAGSAFSFSGAMQPAASLSAPATSQASPAGVKVDRAEAASSSSSAAPLMLLAAGAGGAALARGKAGQRQSGLQASIVRQAAAAPDFSKELGVTPPLGFWDPLGLSKYKDPEIAVQQFKRRRVIEIQHGRVAMLACIGYIVPEYFKWPGYISPSMNVAFADIPNGLKGMSYIPGAGWLQMITFVGIVEVYNLQTTPTGTAGDFAGFGAFGLPGAKSIENPEKRMKSLTAEINNGRLAMMAIIGMFYQDGLTGSAWGDWSLYTDSPLRAAAAPDFSKELGVTPPLGFWDPLGLSKYKDPEIAVQQFKRRRVIEIQHGRVAMLACIGYIVPEYFKWPGYISPSMNVAFADIPNGLKGMSYIPGAGWLQMITFVGIVEVYNLQTTPTGTAGDFAGFGAFGLPGAKSIENPEKRMKSLTAEINNGRLAMMAIIGMFYQDGLTGSAWGDWSLYTDSPLR